MATATLDGVKYGINGQHTCWMRLSLPEDLKKASVRYVEYEVDSMEQLKRLYAVFDVNKVRSHGHLVRALLVGSEETEGVWPSTINLISAGLKLFLCEDRHGQQRIGPHEVASLVTDKYGPLFTTVGTFWQSHKTQSHIKRAGVIGAMFATYEKVPTKADEFWEPVATGLGLSDKGDPRYKLRELLLKVKVQGNSNDKKVRILTSEDIYRHAIQAWNKWRRNEKIENLRGTSERVKPV
jgi:hypothetical protein